MLRVAVMVSGGGTNLQAIIDAVKDGTITNTELMPEHMHSQELRITIFQHIAYHQRIMKAETHLTMHCLIK